MNRFCFVCSHNIIETIFKSLNFQLILCVIFSLNIYFVSGQNQNINYSPKDGLTITSFDVSLKKNQIAINIAPLSETIIYDLYSSYEIKRLENSNDKPVTVVFDDDRKLIIIECENGVNIFNSDNYELIDSYEKPQYTSAFTYNKNSGELVFLAPLNIQVVNVITGERNTHERALKDGYGTEVLKVSDDGSILGQLTNGTVVLYKNYNEITQLKAGDKIYDFLITQDEVIALRSLNRSYVATEYFDFFGNTTSPPNLFNKLFRSYSLPNTLQYVNKDLAFYGTYYDVNLLPRSGRPYKYTFKKHFKSFKFINGLGFIMNYDSHIELVNFEGQLLTSIYASSIYNQSTISQSLNPQDRLTNYILLNEDKLDFHTSSGVESKTLNAPYVNNFDIDNNLLAFAKRNQSISVWDINNKEQIIELKSGKTYPQHLCISKSNNVIAFISKDDETVQVRDLSTGTTLNEIKFDNDVPTSVDINDKWLAVGTKIGDYYTWSVNNSTLTPAKQKAIGLSNAITSIHISGEDLFLASLGRVLKVNVSEINPKNEIVFKGHTGFIHGLNTDPAKQYLMSSAVEGSISLWDIEKNSLLESYQIDSTSVNQISIDNNTIIFANGQGNMGVEIDNSTLYQELSNSRPELIIQSSNTTGSRHLEFSPDGKLIASMDGDKIKIREVLTGFLISEFSPKENLINDFTFDKDGKSVIIVTGRGVEYYDPITAKLKKYLDYSTQNRSLHGIEMFSKRSSMVLHNIHGWHYPLFIHSNSGLYQGELNVNPSAEKDRFVLNVKISSDDKYIATYGSHFIKLFEIEPTSFKTKQIMAIPRQKKEVYNQYWNDLLDFSDDGKYFSYVEFIDNNKTIVYDIESRSVVYDKTGKLSKFGSNNQWLSMDTNTEVSLKDTKTSSKKVFYPSTNHIDLISAIDYDVNQDLFATSDSWGNIKVWNGATGKTINELDRFSNDIYTSEISPNGDFIAYNNKQGIFLFDLKSFKTIPLKGNNYPYFGAFSATENVFYFRDKTIYKYIDLTTLETNTLFDTAVNYDIAGSTKLSEDSSLLMFENKTNSSIEIYSLENRIKIAEVNTAEISNYLATSSEEIIDSENLILQGTGITKENENTISFELFQYNIKTKAIQTLSRKRNIDIGSDFKNFNIQKNTKVNRVSSDKKYYAYQEDFHLKVEDLKSKKIVFDKYIDGYDLRFGRFNPSDTELILGYENGEIQVLSLPSFKVKTRFSAVKGDISFVDIQNQFLLVLGENDKINVFDIDDNYKKVYSTAFIGRGDFVIANNDGYYYASKGATKNVAFKKDSNVYPFEQFDLYYNRPDLVAKNLIELGIKDNLLAEAYYKAYLKRLKNIGFNEQQISGDLNLPELEITNEIPVTIDKGSLDVMISAKDNIYKLDRINVWVNDVPVFGSKGKSVKALNQKEIQETISVKLTKGSNKIQISATNEKGSESLKKTVKVNCDILQDKPTMYLVSIGVSKYANSNFNLKYAAKDALDISAYTKSINDNYKAVEIIELLDEDVTRHNVVNLKQRLNKSKPHDIVVVFFAGHGLLDKNFDYYLATHDIDFENPSVNGLPYEELEGLLDGIEARKKLLLMDACHSGEIDKDDVEYASNNTNQNVKITNRGSEGSSLKTKTVGLKNSFELMQLLFADLRRGTGATVISSASGVEFAYEGEQWQNGVFTYALLEGLKSGSCDLNNDNEVTVSELKNYVIDKVKVLTNGNQNPTSRAENLEWDWMLKL